MPLPRPPPPFPPQGAGWGRLRPPTPLGGRGPRSSSQDYSSQGASLAPSPPPGPCCVGWKPSGGVSEKVWAETGAGPIVGRGGGKGGRGSRAAGGGIGAVGREARNLPLAPGRGGGAEGARRGRDRAIHPWSSGAERLVPPAPRPVQRPRASTRLREKPALSPAPGRRAGSCPAPAARPILGGFPLSSLLPRRACGEVTRPPWARGGGTEGEDRPGRTETESREGGVDAARGIVCVSVCECV